MGDNITDETEVRSWKAFLIHNEKMLVKAEEAGETDKIELFTKNIKHYKELLRIK